MSSDDTPSTELCAERYLLSRQECRAAARGEFLRRKPGVNGLIAAVSELVASLTYFLSGKDLRPIPNGLYTGDLVISFCRSHFLASELVLDVELIDAAVVIRKQMELVSRLLELRAGVDIDELIGRVPNVRHLRIQIRRMYDEYSAIAHSSSPRSLRLLGTLHKDGVEYTPVYPEFDDNIFVALHHLSFLGLEFYLWATDFYSAAFPEYDPSYDRRISTLVMESFVDVFGEPSVAG